MAASASEVSTSTATISNLGTIISRTEASSSFRMERIMVRSRTSRLACSSSVMKTAEGPPSPSWSACPGDSAWARGRRP